MSSSIVNPVKVTSAVYLVLNDTVSPFPTIISPLLSKVITLSFPCSSFPIIKSQSLGRPFVKLSSECFIWIFNMYCDTFHAAKNSLSPSSPLAISVIGFPV